MMFPACNGSASPGTAPLLPAEDARLLSAIRFFTRETEILSDLSVACGAGDRLAAAMDGESVHASSVFDLASLTKLFTGICLLRLRELGQLDPLRPVAYYDPRFVHLRDVSVAQVMTFALSLQTPGRVDACPDRESGLRCLFAIASAGPSGPRAYSDMPAMVLKYVVEAASGLPLMDCVRRLILEPAGMRETWARIPEERLPDAMDYNGEYRLERGVPRLRLDARPGVPHDPKAALLQGDTGDLCGHAGLFSTLEDLIRFCRAMLGGKILSSASLEDLAVNRTGRPLDHPAPSAEPLPGGASGSSPSPFSSAKPRPEGASGSSPSPFSSVGAPPASWSQFLGVCCYVRHPVQYYSEIPVYMGHRAFGIGGFTGNHLSIDPERNLFTVFLGNRVKNRLTTLLPEDGKTLEDYGLRPDGVGRVLRPDGVWVPSSVHYVHQKDAHLHAVISRVLSLPEVPFTPAPPSPWQS